MNRTTQLIMKLTLFLSLLIINLNALAYSVTVKVIEGYKSKPCVSCNVTVKKYGGEVLAEAVTDQNGIVVLNGLKGKKISIVAHDVAGNYRDNYGYPTGQENEEMTIIVYPTDKFELKILAKEDSLYGKVKESESTSDELSDTVEIQKEASFPGGDIQLQRFIAQTVIYPRICIEMNEMGKVLVSFIVEKNGEISHVKIEKSVSSDLDREAKRVIRAMPKWNTGIHEDMPVRVRCRVPINFALT